MPRKGRDFELEYKWLYELDSRYKVTSPARLYDYAAETYREIDVLIEFTDPEGKNRKVAVECRDRSRNEDVMWIEQLYSKREDLQLDYIIAVTTKQFSEGSKNKAKAHGVILEQAEMLGPNSIKDLTKQFYVDVFFYKLDVISLQFIVNGNNYVDFMTFMNKLNFGEQADVMKFLNEEIYYQFEPTEVIEQEAFFSNDDNSIVETRSFALSQDSFLQKKHKVLFLNIMVKITPIKLSLPFEKSVSVFNGEDHSNKNYKAVFGNDEDYLRIGYLNGQVETEIKLRKRKYLRLAGVKMYLNTIIPKEIFDKGNYEEQLENILENYIGKFDITRIM